MHFGPFPFDYGGPFWIHDLFLLIIVVAIIVGIYFLLRSGSRPAGRSWYDAGARGYRGWSQRNHALDELDLRYARGELDRVEYLQRRADLLGMPPEGPPGSA